MGNGNSKDNAPEAPGLMGKLGGIPRAAAITEGRRAKGGQPKLPPNAIRSQPEDWAFIEVLLSLSKHCTRIFCLTIDVSGCTAARQSLLLAACTLVTVRCVAILYSLCHSTFQARFVVYVCGIRSSLNIPPQAVLSMLMWCSV